MTPTVEVEQVVIDGKAIAAQVRAEVAEGVAAFVERHGRRPGLATVLVGSDPASEVYVRNKRRACVAAGMADHHHRVDEDATQDEVEALVDALAADDSVSGILLQLPLPAHLDSVALVERIPADKDVDGLTAVNAGLIAQGRPGLVPCTPGGVIRLLDQHQVELSGARAVVIGRSILVGRPMAALLTQRDATVTLCHSRTVDLAARCREADILVVASGQRALVQSNWVRPGAVVIDVGIHRTDDGLAGDVAPGAAVQAALVTPVPGGVGPMTIAMLLSNTLLAAERAAAV
ncbi:bifunctional methylenetetrahydrofolate dehydrogenase/methenyltetrahydrofolate cyclohydrolase FolD [Gordonia terrae]|uniref:bifunctional methylenetetrahydrofolate dehydrogenase/methenyltetrahydrofolate cyclohydrolase FolD n=1 Tax=Gordonia hongkongensis TaxID=1701090 RepID=UPI0022B41E23|nr:bifunctional methylenetetrahydrofolate dehydrogenase/methenyltetrahydrofolate cyclohydrolase FolD [Gordonia terrae]